MDIVEGSQTLIEAIALKILRATIDKYVIFRKRKEEEDEGSQNSKAGGKPRRVLR